MKDVLPLAGLLAGLVSAGICLFARRGSQSSSPADRASSPAPAKTPTGAADLAYQCMALALGVGAISFVPLIIGRASAPLTLFTSQPYTILHILFLLALSIGLGMGAGTLSSHDRRKTHFFWLDSVIIGGSIAAVLWWVLLERKAGLLPSGPPFGMLLARITFALSCLVFAQSLLLRPTRSTEWTSKAIPALLVTGTALQVLFGLRFIAPFGGAAFDLLIAIVSPLLIALSLLLQTRATAVSEQTQANTSNNSEFPIRQLDLLLVLALPCLTILIEVAHLSAMARTGKAHPGAFGELWWGPIISILAATRLTTTLFGGTKSTGQVIDSLTQTVSTLRDQLNRRTRQLTTLHAVTADFSNTLDVERLMATALEQMREALDAPVGAIWLRMDDAHLVASQSSAANGSSHIHEAASLGSAAVLLREVERSIAERRAIESLRNGDNSTAPIPAFQPIGRRWRQVQVQGGEKPEGQLRLQMLHDALEMGDLPACAELCRTHAPLAGHAHVVPIAWKGEMIGALGIIRNGVWEADEYTLVEALATEVGAALLNAQLYQEASRLADRDGLTDLLNHRSIQVQLSANLSRAIRTKTEFSVVMMDVKNFKFFNDTYGHPVGDQVLRTVARCLTDATRTSDVLGRFGGDEFMAILLDTDSRGTIEVCSRIAERLQHESFQESNDGRRIPIAISFGAALFPDDGKSVMELLSVAQGNLEDARYGNAPMLANLEKNASQEAQELRKLKEASEGGTFGVLDALVTAIDNKDHYTRRHSEDVTHWATLMAKQLNFTEETQRAVRISGLLHDVGKIAVPDSILRKPGRLNDDEFQIMQQHPVFGALIVKEVPHLTEVLGGIRHHHERFDGRGYPDKLSGESIPVLGRLLAVPDCFSAMTTERPYRKALSWQEAISEIEKGRGSQFDPLMANAFLEVIARIIAEKAGQIIQEHSETIETDDLHKPNIRPRSIADVEKVS
jgi:diguanylate cyclase (GGDEF)-like protein